MDNRQHARSDAIFMAALLLSMVLHALVLYFMPRPENEELHTPQILSVEIQPPPKPLPPPEPRKKPEPEPEKEKPKTPPKKPLPPPPKPKPTPAPRVEPPISQPREPEPVKPAQPPVIAAPPPPTPEPPHEFVAPAPQPEPPPRPKGPSEQDLENARGNYSALLSREFAKYKQYPRLAQMRGWQGTVKVELHVDANGNILSSTISEKSNFDVLDRQALEMVRKASPLPQPPDILRGREFTIVVPVVFKLE